MDARTDTAVTWKVTVEQSACQGYACCVMAVPSVFDLDDDTGKAVVVTVEPADSLRSAVDLYDGLILATGSSARRLDWIDGYSDRIRTLRTVEDCQRLHELLHPGARLLVIGGGFIGLEVAATARELKAEVILVEIRPEPLAAVLGTRVGSWFRRLHERQGGIRPVRSCGACRGSQRRCQPGASRRRRRD